MLMYFYFSAVSSDKLGALLMNNTKNEIDNLTSIINKHRKAYHLDDQPTISDQEYDKLIKQLKDLETSFPELVKTDSPTKQVGYTPGENFKQTKHSIPMLSIKTETNFTEQGAIDFYNRIKAELNIEDIHYILEPKYDGLAISLIYKNGVLVEASTRGDGTLGELVTEQIRTIKDIPKVFLNGYVFEYPNIEIRGEVYMKFSVLEEINKTLKKPLANVRNAAAGSVRQKDPKITAKRQLSFFPYSIDSLDNTKLPNSQLLRLELIKNLGFVLSDDIVKVNNLSDIIQYYEIMKVNRVNLDYAIDGVVYKVDDKELQNKLGMLIQEPRWAIAHKFPATEQITILKDIEVQIGRTGKVTPVAKLQPVHVDGVTISSVTLHNYNEIKNKDVRIGDHVIVRRAGDVIPEIVGPYLNLSTNRKVIPTVPSNCPVCGSVITPIEDSVEYRCSGDSLCPAQSKGKFEHFISKRAFNIEGFGEKLVDQLVDQGNLVELEDIFSLGGKKASLYYDKFITHSEQVEHIAYHTLRRCELVGDRKAEQLMKYIAKAKRVSLDKFIYSLGIPNIGENGSKILAEYYQSITELTLCSYTELIQLKDFGEKTAKMVYEYFHNKNNLLTIDRLIKLGVSIYYEEKTISTNLPLSGLRIALTGVFDTKRSELEYRLKTLGATITDNVDSKLNILVAGTNPKSKLLKAQKLNIYIAKPEELNYALQNPINWVKHIKEK